MSRTTWTVQQDSTLGKVTLTVETTDPRIVRAIELAAEKQGVELIRTLTQWPGERADPDAETHHG